MSFSVEEKSSFIKEYTKSGALNKSKQAGVIYDLVIKKYNELMKSLNFKSGTSMDDSEFLTKTVTSLKETVDDINRGVNDLTLRLDKVEERIDSLATKKTSRRVKLKSDNSEK